MFFLMPVLVWVWILSFPWTWGIVWYVVESAGIRIRINPMTAVQWAFNFVTYTENAMSMKVYQARGRTEVVASCFLLPWPMFFVNVTWYSALVLFLIAMSLLSGFTHRHVVLRMTLFELHCAAFVLLLFRKKQKTKVVNKQVDMIKNAIKEKYAFHLWKSDPVLFMTSLLEFRYYLYRVDKNSAYYWDLLCLLTRIDTVHVVLFYFRLRVVLPFVWVVQQPFVYEALGTLCALAWPRVASAGTFLCEATVFCLGLCMSESDRSSMWLGLQSRVQDARTSMNQAMSQVNVKALLHGTKQYKDPESRQEAIHRIKAVLQPKSERQKAIDHIRAVLEKNRDNK
jgi:hypothetical protein